MNKLRITALDLVHCPVTAKTTWSFIQLTRADGVSGWGEASWVREPGALDPCHANARRDLLGRPWGSLDAYIARDTRGVPQAAIASALEQALWDIRGKDRADYAASLMGGGYRTRIPLYANINRSINERNEAGFARAGLKARAAGFSRIKIAPFDGLTPDTLHTPPGRQRLHQGLARVAATRAAIGPDAALYVDCHWRFDRLGASAVLKELAALGVSWFECPLAETPENIPALKLLRGEANSLGIRLAGLEELTHPQAFRPWLAAGAYDVVMPDVKYARGIAGVTAVAALAAYYGAGCAPHNPSGPVAHAASLVACAISADIEQLEHQFDETPAFWRLMDADFPRPAGGASITPTHAGLGTALRW